MLTCDLCGRTSDHFFVRWERGDGELWSCKHCIDLGLQLWEFLDGKCLNGFEVCRLLNGVEEASACHRGQQFGATRGWKCQSEPLGCTFHYTKVYAELRKLERRGVIQSKKRRFWDKTPMQTDVFRFWFIKKRLTRKEC